MLITPKHAKVDIGPGGCWLWNGHCNDKGYAMVSRQGKARSAHRWNWEQVNGPIPDGLEANHRCRIRSCINPEHLELLTHGENIRYSADLKETCAKGHPYDKVKIDRGYRSRYCSICAREYAREYRAKNRERVNEIGRNHMRRKRDSND